MARRIVIIQGHPDPGGKRYGHALANAYAGAARAQGHTVEVIDVAHLEFPLIRTQDEWNAGNVPPGIAGAQEAIRRAEHIVIFFPLWLGTMPALLKAFLEQVFRPGFAVSQSDGATMWKKLLTGRSARVVVTMGMPAFVYRWFFRAHALKGLERNILRFCGIAPISETLIGSIESDASTRERWIDKLRALGQSGK